MAKRLEGKVAVVTGGGRGLGCAHALALAAEGAKVVVNDLGTGLEGIGSSMSAADEVVARINKDGGEAVVNYDSVATWKGAESIIRTAIKTFGRLDILVNNAGITRDRMSFNMSEEEWDAVIKVHLYGHFYCTRHACTWFRQQWGGRIINTSSHAGLGTTGQINYSCAKEGIVALTRCIAREMGKYGVTCNAIRPRAGTRMTQKPGLKEAWKRMGRLDWIEILEEAKPEDVAPFVVYLASDEAANINGCTFGVWGGTVTLFSEPAEVNVIYKDGRWTVDELARIVPQTIAAGLVNPAPAEKKGSKEY